jgi:hypothetical protein
LIKGALVSQAWGGVKSVWSASKAFVVDGTVVGEVVGPAAAEQAGEGVVGVSTSAPSTAAVAPKAPLSVMATPGSSGWWGPWGGALQQCVQVGCKLLLD